MNVKCLLFPKEQYTQSLPFSLVVIHHSKQIIAATVQNDLFTELKSEEKAQLIQFGRPPGWERNRWSYKRWTLFVMYKTIPYQLSPHDAALFNDCDIAMLVRLSLWLWAWKISWPISRMCVEMTTKHPREKPIIM